MKQSEEVKILAYMIRQVRHSKRHGMHWVSFYHSKVSKKQRRAYQYLVEHAEEIKQAPTTRDVAITESSVTIYYSR